MLDACSIPQPPSITATHDCVQSCIEPWIGMSGSAQVRRASRPGWCQRCGCRAMGRWERPSPLDPLAGSKHRSMSAMGTRNMQPIRWCSHPSCSVPDITSATTRGRPLQRVQGITPTQPYPIRCAPKDADIRSFTDAEAHPVWTPSVGPYDDGIDSVVWISDRVQPPRQSSKACHQPTIPRIRTDPSFPRSRSSSSLRHSYPDDRGLPSPLVVHMHR